MANDSINQPNPGNDPVSRQTAIAIELAPHAIEFNKTREIPLSVPIATGYCGLEAQFISPLPQIHAAEADSEVVLALKTALRRFNCDAVGIFSPIHIQSRPDSEDDADRYGLCIEVHAPGASPMLKIIELVRREADQNFFGPLVPCKGIPFGVTYPSLFDGQDGKAP